MAKPRGTRTTTKALPTGKTEMWIRVSVKNIASGKKKIPGGPPLTAIIPVCKAITTMRWAPLD